VNKKWLPWPPFLNENTTTWTYEKTPLHGSMVVNYFIANGFTEKVAFDVLGIQTWRWGDA